MDSDNMSCCRFSDMGRPDNKGRVQHTDGHPPAREEPRDLCVGAL